MDYIFNGKITLETPIMKEYVEMMIKKTLLEMNASVLQNQKETPVFVEVTVKK